MTPEAQKSHEWFGRLQPSGHKAWPVRVEQCSGRDARGPRSSTGSRTTRRTARARCRPQRRACRARCSGTSPGTSRLPCVPTVRGANELPPSRQRTAVNRRTSRGPPTGRLDGPQDRRARSADAPTETGNRHQEAGSISGRESLLILVQETGPPGRFRVHALALDARPSEHGNRRIGIRLVPRPRPDRRTAAAGSGPPRRPQGTPCNDGPDYPPTGRSCPPLLLWLGHAPTRASTARRTVDSSR